MIAFFTVADASIVVALIGVFATLVATRRNGKEIKQINNAVNHVPLGTPTLIQRVMRLENKYQQHAVWELKAFSAIAKQLGIELPEPPQIPEEEESHPHRRKYDS